MSYLTTTRTQPIGTSGRNQGTYEPDNVRGFRVPDLLGLTIAEAGYEWTHRYGRRITTYAKPYNVGGRGASTETWEGFTGGIDTSGLPPDAIVTGFTTNPLGSPGEVLPTTASVQLLAAGTYTLVTAGGDPLVTPSGDPLIVEIA